MQRLPRRGTKKPTKRTTQIAAPALDAADSTAETAAPATEVNEFYQAALDELLAEFDAGLKENPALDSQTREAMSDQFRQLMADAAAAGGDTQFNVPDRAEWAQAVDALQKSGELQEEDARNLMRQLDEALAPLERRESKLAIEFSRRLTAEGEEKALAWLQQEYAKLTAAQTKSPAPASRKDRPSLRSEVINSRSRRLRAPPRLG